MKKRLGLSFSLVQGKVIVSLAPISNDSVTMSPIEIGGLEMICPESEREAVIHEMSIREKLAAFLELKGCLQNSNVLIVVNILSTIETLAHAMKCELCGEIIGTTDECAREKLISNRDDIHGTLHTGNENCPECGVKSGKFHHFGCVREICPKCRLPYVVSPGRATTSTRVCDCILSK